jgi:hypothetical protein
MPGPTLQVDERLKEFAATDRQREFVDAVNQHHSIRAAARALDIDDSTIVESLKRLRKRAAILGYSPEHDMVRTVPEPFVVKGTSTLYDADGKPKLQWVKSKLDAAQYEAAVRAAVTELAQGVTPLNASTPPQHADSSLCNVYTLTDCHVGMYAWGKESGEDWDLKIAEDTLVGAFEHMVRASPKAKTAVVAQLGDFLHFDSFRPVTPEHGHLLDADSRFSKVVSVAVRILRRTISLALARHDQVIVLMAEGNHDPASSVWLRVIFSQLYENDPRVQVIDSDLPYYVHQHGQTMLAWHHGHLRKPDQLPLIFAAQFPQMWGTTKYRYAHSGHRHHVDEKEHAGIIVIQHPTMAARDAYAARGGWVSLRQVTAITYHNRYGQVARNTVVPEMLSCNTPQTIATQAADQVE